MHTEAQLVTEARYDAVADFYVAGWSDACDDPATAALLELAGPIAGLDVLDVACGHGRVARALARRGARVVGVDISRNLLDVAEQIEESAPQGIEYRHVDLTSGAVLGCGDFDLAVCNFALSDVDDLDAALASVSRALRPGGRFVASMVHPCFPGAGSVSGSWPPDQPYSAEGRWMATGAASSLRRQVGATHRMLSTYLNALVRHSLVVAAAREPNPPADWIGSRREAARLPVFLVLAATKGPTAAGSVPSP